LSRLAETKKHPPQAAEGLRASRRSPKSTGRRGSSGEEPAEPWKAQQKPEKERKLIFKY